MSEYDIKQSSNTVGSVAIASLLAARIFTGPHRIHPEDFDQFKYNRNAYQTPVTSSTLDQYRNVITGEYYQGHDPSEGIILARFNPFITQLNHWIDSISIPQKWVQEVIHPPTLECRALAKSVVLKLLKEHQLYPSRISATIEEGVFVNYIDHINKRNLSIEIYNDLDIAVIITQDKEIITSIDISNEDFAKIIQIFQTA